MGYNTMYAYHFKVEKTNDFFHKLRVACAMADKKMKAFIIEAVLEKIARETK